MQVKTQKFKYSLSAFYCAETISNCGLGAAFTNCRKAQKNEITAVKQL